MSGSVRRRKRSLGTLEARPSAATRSPFLLGALCFFSFFAGSVCVCVRARAISFSGGVGRADVVRVYGNPGE